MIQLSHPILFAVAVVLTALFTPGTKYLARHLGAIDEPGQRRIHAEPTPRLGGIGMFAAFWLVILLTVSGNHIVYGLFFGSLLLLLVGIYDDARGMRPLLKFVFQLAAAAIPFAFGLEVESVALPMVGSISLGVWGYIFALFWIVGLVNTVNLCDGMDGLAAGICFLAALILSWSAFMINQQVASILLLALAGVALGFLFFNFHPAKVFMGDSGAMFLGYMLGGVTLMGTLKTATIVSLLFPLLVLGLPLVDIAFAIVRRKIKGRPISRADQGHLHHRLLDAGCTQRQAVLVLYGISFLFGVSAILIALNYYVPAVILIVLDLVVISLIMLRRFSLPPTLTKAKD
jgi:UDP-GlcNAc:undecaprenyl-phosphate GlcNAc-1-phosphate transferase